MARLMIGAGGTGGHIYPALAVVEALQTHALNRHSIIYVGSSEAFERPLIAQSGVVVDAYEDIAAGPLNGVGVVRAALSVGKIALGILQSVRLIRHHQPQALLLTGGWANVPLALAAYILRVPMLVYLPDIEPGKTIQYLARIARRVALTVADSAHYFPNTATIVTGYPLRQSVLTATRSQAIAHFGLDADRRTLLVFGGSRGARSLNQTIEAILPDLLADGVQLIHVTGTLDWERSQAAVQSYQPHPHYHPFAYLHEAMGLALAVADIVICRSGASVLGELPHVGAASILVPYPHAWRYQKTNADWLVDRGAAIQLEDAALMTDLLPMLRNLLQDKVQLTAMQAQSRVLARDGAQALADELVAMADKTA